MKQFVPALALLSILAMGCQQESAPSATSIQETKKPDTEHEDSTQPDEKPDEGVTHSTAKPVSAQPPEVSSEESKVNAPEADPAESETADSKPDGAKPEPDASISDENGSK